MRSRFRFLVSVSIGFSTADDSSAVDFPMHDGFLQISTVDIRHRPHHGHLILSVIGYLPLFQQQLCRGNNLSRWLVIWPGIVTCIRSSKKALLARHGIFSAAAIMRYDPFQKGSLFISHHHVSPVVRDMYAVLIPPMQWIASTLRPDGVRLSVPDAGLLPGVEAKTPVYTIHLSSCFTSVKSLDRYAAGPGY